MKGIKVRAWAKRAKEMFGWEDILNCGNMEYIFMHPEHFIIMLYSGRKDKNGKDIYDGDILYQKYPPGLMSSGHTHVVEWSEVEDSYCYDVSSPHFTIDINLLEHYEVVGNIYENKELITLGQ